MNIPQNGQLQSLILQNVIFSNIKSWNVTSVSIYNIRNLIPPLILENIKNYPLSEEMKEKRKKMGWVDLPPQKYNLDNLPEGLQVLQIDYQLIKLANEQFTCTTNHPSVKKLIILNFDEHEISIQDINKITEFTEHFLPFFPNAQVDIHDVDQSIFTNLNTRIQYEKKILIYSCIVK